MAMNNEDLKKLFRQRLNYIDSRQNRLIANLSRVEQKLLAALLSKVYQELVVKQGLIDAETNPISLTNAVDDVFTLFIRKRQMATIGALTRDLENIFEFNKEYYSLFTTNKKRYAGIASQTKDIMRSKIGLTLDDNIKPNSYLDQLTKNISLRNEIRSTLFKAVARQQRIAEVTDAIGLQVVGNRQVDGGLVKHYKGLVYDTYVQYDRTTNIEFANRLDLKYFVYAGGLIETSRRFCQKRDGRMFTKGEAERTWAKDPTLPRTAAERASGTLIGYNPLVDMGRWNCRHLARFVTKEIADELEPNLLRKSLAKRSIVEA